MAIADAILTRLPRPFRKVAIKHRELIKFTVVGATTFVADNAVWYLLKLSILAGHPTTAKGIGILVATVISYVLNREWSFRTRAGREKPHEATLFFAVSGSALIINLIPLYASRYLLDLEVPHVGRLTQELADFVSGSVIGVILAMMLRFYGFKKWVFPDELGARRRS